MNECQNKLKGNCPETEDSFGPVKCLNKDIGIVAISFIVAFTVWVIASIYSVQAKADRVIAIEEKVDFIYKFLINKTEKN